MTTTNDKAPSLVAQVSKGTVRRLRKLIGLPIREPYMVQREIDLLTEVLQDLQPQRCLEYGSGYSTLFFPSFLPETATWFSVEHHEAWHQRIREMNTDQRVTIEHASTAHPEDGRNEYVLRPQKHGPFDFILVDGVNREACITMAHKLLKPDGLLVVHDANRRQYHGALTLFTYRLVMEDSRRTAGGMAFASHSKPIGSYFRLRHHARLWHIQAILTNIGRFKYLPGRKAKPCRVFSPGQENEG